MMPLKPLDVNQMSKHRTEKEKQELFDSYYRVFLEGRIWSGLLILVCGIIFAFILAYQYPEDPALPKWLVSFIYWLKEILN